MGAGPFGRFIQNGYFLIGQALFRSSFGTLSKTENGIVLDTLLSN